MDVVIRGKYFPNLVNPVACLLSHLQVNEEVFLFGMKGLLFVVVDACTGHVQDKRHFEMAAVAHNNTAIESYIISGVKERSAACNTPFVCEMERLRERIPFKTVRSSDRGENLFEVFVLHSSVGRLFSECIAEQRC